MPVFMIPFNGKITGVIRGQKKQIDYHFRGGNGTAEPYPTHDEEEIEILRQCKQAWEIDPEDTPEPALETETDRPKATHVGAITTHADQPETPPPDLPEEVDKEDETPQEVAKMAKQDAHELQVAQVVEQLRQRREEPGGYKNHVKPYAEKYGIDTVGRRKESVNREIAEAHIKASREEVEAE